MKRIVALCCLAAACTGTTGLGAPAHEHGVARLDVGVEATRVSCCFWTRRWTTCWALNTRRAPTPNAQKADAAVASLRDAAALFRIDPAAGCTLAKVELVLGCAGAGQG
jgi:hypothetical protein